MKNYLSDRGTPGNFTFEDAIEMVSVQFPFRYIVEQEYGVDAMLLPQEDYRDLIIELVKERII